MPHEKGPIDWAVPEDLSGLTKALCKCVSYDYTIKSCTKLSNVRKLEVKLTHTYVE